MNDFAELNKIKDYFPEHSELSINFSDTNKILKHWFNNIYNKISIMLWFIKQTYK